MKEQIVNIGTRWIAIKDVDKLFFQDGMPVSMSIEFFKKDGIEVSILHVADECLKNGWSPKTTVAKLREDFIDSGTDYDMSLLMEFCNSTYEDQREMIFKYLFSDENSAIEYIKKKLYIKQ